MSPRDVSRYIIPLPEVEQLAEREIPIYCQIAIGYIHFDICEALCTHCYFVLPSHERAKWVLSVKHFLAIDSQPTGIICSACGINSLTETRDPRFHCFEYQLSYLHCIEGSEDLRIDADGNLVATVFHMVGDTDWSMYEEYLR